MISGQSHHFLQSLLVIDHCTPLSSHRPQSILLLPPCLILINPCAILQNWPFERETWPKIKVQLRKRNPFTLKESEALSQPWKHKGYNVGSRPKLGEKYYDSPRHSSKNAHSASWVLWQRKHVLFKDSWYLSYWEVKLFNALFLMVSIISY